MVARGLRLAVLGLLAASCGSGGLPSPSEEGGAPAAALSCPEGSEAVELRYPEGQALWWRFREGLGDREALSASWGFDAWREMREGDVQLACRAADGSWNGPYRQLRRGVQGPDGEERRAWVEGLLVDGRPEGRWRGGWDEEEPGRLAFEGRYLAGQREGPWSFYSREGSETVAQGDFARDRMAGTWTLRRDGAEIRARYVAGQLHGPWSRALPDGSRVTGHYFEGRKDGVWTTTGPLAGGGGAERRELWEEGRRLDLPGEEIPAPSPEPPPGRRRAQLERRVRAYVEEGLSGGFADEASLFQHPVLLDYADPAVLEHALHHGLPLGGSYSLVDRWELVDLQLAPRLATATIELHLLCHVDGEGATPAASSRLRLELPFAGRQGEWRPLYPVGLEHFLYLQSYAETASSTLVRRCRALPEERGSAEEPSKPSRPSPRQRPRPRPRPRHRPPRPSLP